MTFGLGTIKVSRQLEFLAALRGLYSDPATAQRLAQRGFDLGVHTAQFCGGVSLYGGQHLGA